MSKALALELQHELLAEFTSPSFMKAARPQNSWRKS